MSGDFYAGAAKGWAEGAALVYRPIANELIESSPHQLVGRAVLDVGAGTGLASELLRAVGARPVAVDLSHDMLAWNSTERPAAISSDVRALPFSDRSFDDAVAAFVFNHLVEPESGIREVVRVLRPGGALIACVFANSSHSEARDAIDEIARQEGWRVPDWYAEIKAHAIPILGSPADMEIAAARAGLGEIAVEERAVDVGVTEPEALVDYRLGQAQFAMWLNNEGPQRASDIRARAVEAVGPRMPPYRPVVVFLSAVVQTSSST